MNVIVYISCSSEYNVIVVDTVASNGYTENDIVYHSLKQFNINDYCGHLLELVGQIKTLICNADILYIDTIRAHDMFMRMIVYSAYLTYYAESKSHCIQAIEPEDKVYIVEMKHYLILYDNDTEDQFLERIYNAMKAIKGNIEYSTILLDLLLKARNKS